MKVISGKYKGRNLLGYDLDGTRPTMDRVKESLFATIQNEIEGSIILDLFSGSGNLGIEALSQNAKYAYLVDNNKKATNIIEKNLKEIGIQNAKVITADYLKALQRLKEENIKLDIIFLDPPYQTDYIEKSIEKIEEYQLLNKNGYVICESNNPDKILNSKNLEKKKSKKYGDKWVVILKQI